MSFLSTLEASITGGMSAVAATYGGALLGAFRPIFIVGFSVWIMLIAYEVAFGKTEDGLGYFLTKIFRMFLIGTLALYGWPMLTEMIEGIRDVFVGSSGMASILETNLINPMGLLFESLYSWFSLSFVGLGLTDIGTILGNICQFAILGVVFLLMFSCVSIIATIALAMFLVASSILIILLAVGPFFLLCLAFPFTQKFFETFIASVMTSILAMGLTVLMINFVAAFFGLTALSSYVPAVADSATVGLHTKSLSLLFAGKAGTALLITYMFYKVFDLASALGGGVNIGNNMVGAMRTITRDAMGGNRAGGGNSGGAGNSINQGNTGGGGNTSSASSSRGSTMAAIRANRSFAGMGVSAGAGAARAAGRGGLALTRGVARSTANVASYAFNRATGRK